MNEPSDAMRRLESERAAFLISEELLERTGKALLSRDFDAFHLNFTMPTLVETFEGRRIIDTVEKLRDAFDGACDHYGAHRATDLVRNVLAAEFQDDVTIRSTHECRVLAGDVLSQAPFAVYSQIVVQDGRWKVAESIYVVDNAPLFTRALSFGSGRHQASAD